MQNSEIYRRGFVVPLNEEAERALLANDVTYGTVVDFYELPNDRVFESLWAIGFFDEINAQLGAMLDDYEEGEIKNAQIRALREIAIRFKDTCRVYSPEKEAITELIRLCDAALKCGRSVFFVL